MFERGHESTSKENTSSEQNIKHESTSKENTSSEQNIKHFCACYITAIKQS